MARDWYDLFLTNHGAPVEAPSEPEREERRRGFFKRIRENMRKTREALTAEVQATLFEGDLDEETWERLEEALIYADVGAATTAQVVEELEREAEEGSLVGGEALTGRLAELLAQLARTGDDKIDLRPDPTVILVVGVNGTGKTTTIGKLAWHLRNTLDRKVVIGAADTFRAAAVEQLERWGERAGVDVIKGPEGSDPGAVAFDAIARGREAGADVIIIDTAGPPAHADQPDGRADQGPPGDLQADARRAARDADDRRRHDRPERRPPGQALRRGRRRHRDHPHQARRDREGRDRARDRERVGIPVKLIGIGEQLEDLRPFDADDFARALLTA